MTLERRVPTATQVRILQLIADGLTSEYIGRLLYRSERTVKTHRADMYHRIGAVNSAHAVNIAYQNGWWGFPAPEKESR
jgi:DNA-binding CsgD family transcriptional regulator